MSIASLIDSGRRLVESTLLDSVVIFDVVETPDDSGGTHVVLAPRPGVTPCRFGPLSDKDLVPTAGTMETPPQAVVTFRADLTPEILEGCRLRALGGSTWVVVGKLYPPSVMRTAQRVLVREVGA